MATFHGEIERKKERNAIENHDVIHIDIGIENKFFCICYGI